MNAQHPKATQYIKSGFFNDLSSLAELNEKIGALPTTKAQGDAFEIFIEAYLATKRQNDFKQVWPELAIPHHLRIELNVPDDHGVDGICLNHLGTYDAYQVKWRSPGYVLNYNEVSNLYASSRKFESRVLITNCYDVVQYIKEQEATVFILGAHLENLCPKDFREITAWIQGGQIETTKTPLRDDQIDAVTVLTKELETADRASCIMACGTGKTLVAVKAWEAHKSQTTIVFVPSLALMGQILDEFRNKGTSFKSLCVCSDPTVDDDDAPKTNECGFKVTLHASVVRRFLDGPDDLPKIVFSTYQSSPIIKEAGKSFDLAIFDEAHRTAGREGRAYSLPLDDKYIPIKKRLFFTATPCHCTPAQRTAEGEFVELYSMDNPAMYGRQVHKLSVRQALNLPVPPIAPYKVLVSFVTGDEVHHELLKQGETLVNVTPVRARQVANQIALRDAIQQHGIKKVFTFHSRVASAESFVSQGDEGIGTHLEGFSCNSINGTMSAKVRNDILQSFKDDERAILSNARCLTEGVNVPSVDCVGLFAPLKSKVSVAQAMGRAMRKAEGKEFGYVLVPIYIESGEDMDTAARRSKFDVVLDVLQTLKEQDEVLAEELRQIMIRKVKGHDDTRGLRDVIFREPAIAPDVPLGDLMASIRVQCLDALIGESELRWQQQYQKALRYYQETGDCNVPESKDPFLRKWQHVQRLRYRQGGLSTHRIQLLEAIPGWAWDMHEALWQENYRKTLQYHQEKNNCNIRTSYDRALYHWQQGQRNQYKKGTLASHRITQLSNIPTWLWVWDPLESAWQEQYQKTLQRHKEKGDCRIPAPGTEDAALCNWQNTQRNLYKKGKLASERIQFLEAVPSWIWDPFESAWQEQYQKTLRLQKDNGDCNAAKSKDPDLWRWQHQQRLQYTKGKQTPERVKLLEAIPGCFLDHLQEAAWQENYRKTLRRHEGVGDCNVSYSQPSSEDDLFLARWQSDQRQRYNKGILRPDRLKLLEAIPSWMWKFKRIYRLAKSRLEKQ